MARVLDVFSCKHDPYQGRCVHCNVPFVDGRPYFSPVPASEPEPVAWRWKPKGSAVLWIYDPKPEWLAAQDPETIDKEPLYANPVPTPDGAAKACQICGGPHDNDMLSDICQDCESSAPWRNDALSAAQQAGEADRWRPIATAPKDETLFLAACPPDANFPDGRVMIWKGSIFAFQNDRTPEHLKFPATHWMPLPTAPLAAKPEGE